MKLTGAKKAQTPKTSTLAAQSNVMTVIGIDLGGPAAVRPVLKVTPHKLWLPVTAGGFTVESVEEARQRRCAQCTVQHG
jgi:hypothetical protein